MSDDASPISRIAERQCFPGEHVADMHRPYGRKDDESVAIRVTRTEIIQVDFIFPFADCEFVVECALWKELGLISFEFVHLHHVRLRVRVHHAIDSSAEELITSDMVAMRMGV